jgi:hypothetical protein
VSSDLEEALTTLHPKKKNTDFHLQPARPGLPEDAGTIFFFHLAACLLKVLSTSKASKAGSGAELTAYRLCI